MIFSLPKIFKGAYEKVETKKFGLLLAMMEPPEEMEEEFNEWYDTEHVPERECVPGILSARRFVAQEGFPRYLAIYDLDTVEVLQGDAYKRIGGDNLSPWSKRVLRYVRGLRRNVYEQTFPGKAEVSKETNALMLLANDIHADKEKDFNHWYDTECIPHFREIDGFINARRFICVEGSPKFLALHEFKDVDLSKNGAYKKLFSTEQAIEIRKYFQDSITNIYTGYAKN